MADIAKRTVEIAPRMVIIAKRIMPTKKRSARAKFLTLSTLKKSMKTKYGGVLDSSVRSLRT